MVLTKSRKTLYLIIMLVVVALWLMSGGIYIESSYPYYKHGGGACTAVEVDITPSSTHITIPLVLTLINNTEPYALDIVCKAPSNSRSSILRIDKAEVTLAEGTVLTALDETPVHEDFVIENWPTDVLPSGQIAYSEELEAHYTTGLTLRIPAETNNTVTVIIEGAIIKVDGAKQEFRCKHKFTCEHWSRCSSYAYARSRMK